MIQPLLVLDLSNERRFDALLGKPLKILLTHLSDPAVGNEIRPEPFILLFQVLTPEVTHEEPCHQDARDATDGCDDESPPLAQVVLDWGESLGTDGGADLANGSGETVASSADGSGVRLAADEPEHVAGAEVARGLHEAVEDDKERDDLGDLIVSTSDDKAEDEVPAKADHHSVAAANLVTQIGTNKNTRQRDSAEEKLVLCGLHDVGIFDNAGNNGALEDAG
jgi:hypothetical protein